MAGELACDWHTVNDAVTTYGKALLEADRKRLNQTSAIGLDETSFVARLENTDYATTVADVENHQIIEILPTRKYADVAGWIDQQPAAWKERIASGLDMSATYAAVIQSCFLRPPRSSTPSTSSPWPTAASTPSAAGSRSNSWATGDDATIRSFEPVGCCSWEKRSSRPKRHNAWRSLLELGDPGAEVAIAYRIKERLRDFYRTTDPDEGPPDARAELQGHCLNKRCRPRSNARTHHQPWFDKIANFHLARVSNGPTDRSTT